MPIVDLSADDFIRNNFGAQNYRYLLDCTATYADGDQVGPLTQIDVTASVDQVLVLKQIAISSDQALDGSTANYHFYFFDRDVSAFLADDNDAFAAGSSFLATAFIGYVHYDPTATGTLWVDETKFTWLSTGEITLPLVETGDGLWMVIKTTGSSSVSLGANSTQVQLWFL